MHNEKAECRANETFVRLVLPMDGGAVTIETETALTKLQAVSKKSAFNEWLGIEVTDASERQRGVAIGLAQRVRTIFGVLARRSRWGADRYRVRLCGGDHHGRSSSISLLGDFFRPAVATRFIARGKILKLGKRQIFCRAEVYGDAVTDKRLFASGETILMVVSLRGPVER